jgi:hypothetical protein
MDKYTVELYDWIATQDATFTKDVSFADFDKKISTDDNYAKSMYNWISSIDNTFSSDVSEQDFIGKVKKKEDSQPVSVEESMVSTAEPQKEPVSSESLFQPSVEELKADPNIQLAMQKGLILESDFEDYLKDLQFQGAPEMRGGGIVDKGRDPFFAKKLIETYKTRTKDDIRKEVEDLELDNKSPYRKSASGDDFVENVYSTLELARLGIDYKDFDGFLEENGYKEEFLKNEELGVHKNELTRDMNKSKYLNLYVNDITERSVAGQQLKRQYETGLHPDLMDEKFSPQTGIDYQGLSGYRAKNMPALEEALIERQRNLQDKYKEALEQGDLNIMGETNFWRKAVDRPLGLLTLGLDVVGADGSAEKMRAAKERREFMDTPLHYATVSGKKVDIGDEKYIVSDDGQVYDVRRKINITSVAEQKLLKEITEKAKTSKDRDRSISFIGMSIEGANVAGDLVGQIAVQSLMAKAAGRAPLKTGSNILKTPISRDFAVAMVSQGTLGFAMGYEETLKQARAAGINEEKARELASSAAVEMGGLYAMTAIINPRTKAVNAVTGVSTKVSDAVKGYLKTGDVGFKKVFTVNAIEALKEIPKEGAKELVQENIQQAGEMYKVNPEINRQAGEKILKDTITIDEFITTSILSFAAGGLMPGAGSVSANITSAAAKKIGLFGDLDELQALDLLSKNRDQAESVINMHVKTGAYTQQQAKDLLSDIDAYSSTIESIPKNITAKQKKQAIQLINEIRKAEQAKAQLDPAFHENVDKQIAEKREQLKNITQQEEQEELFVTPTPDVVDEVEEEVQEEEVPEVEEVVEEVERPKETVGDIINRPVTLTSLGGSQLDTPIKGDLYVDGQQVVVEDSNGNITEIGNFADIADTSVADLGIEYQTAQVTANPDGTLTIDNKNYTIQDDLPTGGLVFDEDGNVTEASVKDATGKPVMFKGSLAEDIAYQILLSRAESPEQRQNITEKLDKDEEFQNILREAQEPTEETADTDTKQVARGNRLFNEPLQDATTISDRFTKRKGIDQPTTEVSKVLDKEKSKRIAKAFEKLKSNPNDPKVKKAYNALAEETVEQYQELVDAGYVIEINNEEPYANSAEMIEDFRKNKRIKIFSTESGFGSNKITDKQRQENPMLRDSGFKDTNGKPLLINDLFRAVHDFFGHAKEGNSFGPKGEEIAWSIHSRMFSTEARRAMTTETRGQSSWVNFSGVNKAAFAKRDEARALRQQAESENNVDRKRALLEEAKKKVDEAYNEMKFAEQKIALLPDEFVFEGDDVVDQIDRLINAERSIGRMRPMSELNSKEVVQKINDNIELVKKSLLSIVPDIKITPLGQERYFQYTGSDSTQGLYYYKDPKEIVINIDTASPATVFHEAIHAVLYSLTDVNNKFYDETIDRATEKMVESLKKFVDKKTLKKLNNHTKLYFDERKGHEFVAELGAILAEGYESFNTKAKRIIKTWLDSIAKKLGIAKGLTDSDIYNSLRALSIAISKGEDLSTYDKSFIEALVKEEYKKNYLEDFFTSKTSYFTLTAGKTAEEGLIKKGFTQEEASKVVEEYFKRNPVQLEGYKSFRRMFEASKLSPQNGVNTAKENGFSDADIRKWGNSKGFTTAEINDAIKAYEEEKRFKGMQEEGLFNPKSNFLKRSLDKAYRKLLSARGFLGKSTQKDREAMNGVIEANIKKAITTINDLNKVLSKYKNQVDDIVNNLDAFLRGDQDVELPEDVREIAVRMRAHVDGLSKQLVEVGLAKIRTESYAAIMMNIGSYLNRSYEVFDNPNYTPSDEIVSAAKNYLRNAMRGKAYEIAMQENNDPITVLEEMVDREVEKILNKNLESDYKNAASKVGAKKTSLMDRRLEIPFEIRALMGEYTDPAANYARSVKNIVQLVESHRFTNRVRKAGEGIFLFDKPTGEYNVLIASEGSRSLDPLNGMYTTQEIYDALQNRPLISFDNKILNSAYEYWLKSVGTVKYSKTILSVGTHAKNVLGNLAFMMYNGYFNPSDYNNAYNVVKNDFLGQTSEEQRAKLDEYIKAGIISQSVTLQEIRSMFSGEDDFDVKLIKRHQDNGMAARIKRATKRGAAKVADLYQAEDDFFKIVAYEAEKRRYAKAFYSKAYADLDQDQKKEVDDYVSEIVKNILPNYSRIGQIREIIRAVPLVGTFISFEMEAWRTAYNTVKLASDELKDPRTRSIGLKRMAGIMAVNTLKAMIYSSLGLFGGGEDDEEEDGKSVVDSARQFMPPWAKNSNVVVKDIGEGKFKYINVSASDPHGSLDEVLISFLRGETALESFTNAFKQFSSPFFSSDILAGAAMEILRNEDSVTGKPIFLETDNAFEITQKFFSRVWEVAEPGTLTSINRIYESETPFNEFTGQVSGLKSHEVEIGKQTFFRSRDISNRSRVVVRDYTSGKYRYKEGKIDRSELNALYTRANENHKEVYGDLLKLYEAGLKLGASRRDMVQSMKDGGVPMYVIRGIVSGRVPNLNR